FARDELRGGGSFFAARAFIRPLLKFIEWSGCGEFISRLAGIVDVSLLTGGDGKGAVLGRNFSLPTPRDEGRVTGVIHIHAVIACPQERNSCVGRVYLIRLIVIEAVEVKLDPTFSESNLKDLVVQVEKRN